ncbi:hypothetical protein LINPERHAP2_LOCUS26720 [Linum perenne]
MVNSLVSLLAFLVYVIVLISNTIAYSEFYATSNNNITVQPQRGHGSHGGGGHEGGGGGGGREGGGGGGGDREGGSSIGHGPGNSFPGDPIGGSGGQSGGNNEIWSGRCSGEMLPSDSAAMQREILSSFSSITGCFTYDFSSGGAAIRVFGTFTCLLSESECNDCFNAAVKHIQDGCSGSVGAVYSSCQKCCFRYEIYDICSNGG